jgi:heptosyltransferase I
VTRKQIDTPLNSICIVMMSAVGDAVHVLPVINAIKRHSPSSRITWILQPGPAMLVRGHPAVDEIIIFDRSRGVRAFLDIRRELKSRTFDVVLGLQVYLKAGLITAMTKAPVKLGFDRERARDANWLFTSHRIPSQPGQHVQDQYFEFLTALGISPEPVEWGLGPWPEERAYQQEFFSAFVRPVASIVVGTSKAQKDWMPERWAAVANALYDDFGLQPVLVGGRSERELAAEAVIIERTGDRAVSALGSGLRNLVSILDGSALVLSPDTGPLHMSVALGTPVISLIGYTNPRRVGPYRAYRDLMIDAYGNPGEQYGISMENRPNRMSRIAVSDVLDRVELWRRKYARRVKPARA